jgi:hypothetical protein
MLVAFRSLLEMLLGASSVRFDSDGAPFNPTEEILVDDFLTKLPVPEVGVSVLGTESSMGLILEIEDIRAPRFGVDSAADPLGDALELKVLRIGSDSFLPPKEITFPAGSLISLQYMVTYRVQSEVTC